MASSSERYSNLMTQAPPEAPAQRDAGPRLPPAQPIWASFSPSRAVTPREVTGDLPLDHPHLYFNRELSWIDFNWRVLAQAMDPRVPLLERARYLAITQSNLDEFFGKRVGGLWRQKAAGVTRRSPDGRTPEQQLALIRDAVLPMQEAMSAAWENHLRPELEREADIRLVGYDELDSSARDSLHALFRTQIYPVLTPLAADPGHPFPFISNLSHSFAVMLRHPVHGTEHFARVKIPPRHTRWLPVGEPLHFIAFEELIRAHMGELFPGLEMIGAYQFRVTRNADTARNEEEAADLVAMIAEELRQRRFAPVVRLEVDVRAPDSLVELLREELVVASEMVYRVTGLQNLSGLAALANLDLPEHRFEPWEPVIPPPLTDPTSFLAAMRAGDILVHHPYDSFTGTVQRFLEEAASDPKVLAIKQTVYRTSEDSPIVRTLIRAAEEEKQVAVLVELSARFDEERNLDWAEKLESSGAHVIHGVMGLKTHAKTTLVIREEEDGIRTYCHIGTGNYNPNTARLYTDMGLFTASPVIGTDVVDLFHSITGFALAPTYESLIVAPLNMRRRFEELIQREIEIQKEGQQGRIVAKMNAIDDVGLIEALYRASRAGVEIDLIVRGHTRLRPGLPGISDNIRIISVVGRFLEHDRIFLFGNGGDPRVFIGSADWRYRNLVERVEAVVEITDRSLRDRVQRILEMALADDYSAWDLDSDGYYRQRQPEEGSAGISLHEKLMNEARERREQAKRRAPAEA
jgi:polyphosphate kinase